MRLRIVILLLLSYGSKAQVREGFNPVELRACIALCNSYTFLDLYNSDQTIIPNGYQKIYTSPVIGFDNKFQVYVHQKTAYINFRGSTNRLSSWIENMYSAMIPSKGLIMLNGQQMSYTFAENDSAAVHSGYALAIVMMATAIQKQIQELQQKGIHHIILTGHSQGGALAHMCRAYLEHLPASTFQRAVFFKTYAFANPMIGNQSFTEEYDRKFSSNNRSYTIINPADVVPKMPIHYEGKGPLIRKEKLKKWILGQQPLDIRSLGLSLIIRKFEKNIKDYVLGSNRLLERLLSKTSLEIKMPPYVRDINYFHCGKIRKLEIFDYPKILLDPTTLTDKEKSKIKPDDAGNYYQAEPNFYQHKPYNYYVGVLKEYFSTAYKKLDKYYLPEHL